MRSVLSGGQWISVTLVFTACSPTPHVTTSRAELLSRPIFKNSVRAVALAESGSGGGSAAGGDACSQAIDPLIQQAQEGLQNLNQSVAGSNNALGAATGGDTATMAAMMLAASQAMNNGKTSAADTSGATPVSAPTATDANSVTANTGPNNTVTATAGGAASGGFLGPGHSEPNAGANGGGPVAANGPSGTREPATTPGGGTLPHGHDSTSVGAAGSGSSLPLGGGTRGTDGINLTAGSSPNANPDKISLTPASVDKEGEANGFSGYGAGHPAGDGPAIAAALARHSASRAPSSLGPLPVAVQSFGSHADIATRFSPDVFILVSTSYVNYCRINRLPTGGL